MFWVVIGGILMPAVMIFMGKILNNAVNGDSMDFMVSLMLGCGGLVWVIYAFYQYSLYTVRDRVTRKTKQAIFKALLERDWTFFNDFKPQEITQFVENELVYYEKGVDQKMAGIPNSIALVFSALG